MYNVHSYLLIDVVIASTTYQVIRPVQMGCVILGTRCFRVLFGLGLSWLIGGITLLLRYGDGILTDLGVIFTAVGGEIHADAHFL